MSLSLKQLFEFTVKKEASDLFLSAEAPPTIKVHGVASPAMDTPLNAEQVKTLIYSILSEEQISSFEETHELNLAYIEQGVGRFRINVYHQRGAPAMVARFIKEEIPDLDTLGLPKLLEETAMESSGLVLLVGGTGAGKSTTLASMIDYRNTHTTGHILTVEDPIEYVHHHKKCLVDQREVGIDTIDYENALKNAMREAPDVIMIGELRDYETTKHAIAYAETGHLCLSTLHSNTADQALDRIINFFPETAHKQLLQDLAMHLRVIISQRLIIGTDGKRVAAYEIMFNTPFISELISHGRIDEIREAMEKNENAGAITLDSCLFDLFKAGRISQEEAIKHANSRTNLSLRIRLDNPNIQFSDKTKPELEPE